jgi:hypothetical protein
MSRNETFQHVIDLLLFPFDKARNFVYDKLQVNSNKN